MDFDVAPNPIVGNDVTRKIQLADRVLHRLVRNGLYPLARDPQFARELVSLVTLGNCTSIIETGIFHAHTTQFLVNAFPDKRIISVEVVEEYVNNAKALFAKNDRVHIHHGNSSDYLGMILRDTSVVGENPFFFLDAHWYDYLPLLDELKHIFTFGRGIICIHDFQAPDAPEFGFGSHHGRPISLEMIAHVLEHPGLKYKTYFPAVPSRMFCTYEDGKYCWNFETDEGKTRQEVMGRCYILINDSMRIAHILDSWAMGGYLTLGPQSGERVSSAGDGKRGGESGKEGGFAVSAEEAAYLKESSAAWPVVQESIELGLLQLDVGEWAGALAHLDCAERLLDKSTIKGLKYLRALCLYKLGRFAEAEEALYEELRLGPAGSPSVLDRHETVLALLAEVRRKRNASTG